MTGNANGISPIFPACCAKNAMTNWTNATTVRRRRAYQPRSGKALFLRPQIKWTTLLRYGHAGWRLGRAISAIKNWQRARPFHFTPGLPRRNIKSLCVACRVAGREKPPSDVDSAPPPATNGWSSLRSRYRL
ncbi:hypothetical protein KCP69_12360 [Salmonella enterica subsp. enterica]|nr:hypothetical protein KCP69_12360 [Salmonella enterica subsp. enterica]